jgi:[glutamine synthetase] adenylyltransferase / [glutamine synthetase]-adenylyl-L-tyrosine phosphorylase
MTPYFVGLARLSYDHFSFRDLFVLVPSNPSCAVGDFVSQFLALTDETDLRASLARQISSLMLEQPALERGLPRLVQFAENSRVPSGLLVFLDRDHDALPTLLQMLSIDSPALEWLVEDPDSFDWLRMCAGQVVPAETLADMLLSEIRQLDEESQVHSTLKRFRKRETLRVICAVGLHEMQYEAAAQQLAWIADAVVAASLAHVESERKRDRRAGSLSALGISDLTELFAIMSVGSLGGQELELDGELHWVVLRDSREWSSDSLYELVSDEVQREIQQAFQIVSNPVGAAYRVSFPLNRTDTPPSFIPEYHRWIQDVENEGRTWAKLNLMKARYLAGSPKIAHRFLEDTPRLVYHRYLSQSDIIGIGAMNRKQMREENDAPTSDKSHSRMGQLSHCKLEIEHLVQFLQLIHGGENKQVQCGRTLQALDLMEQASSISTQERHILENAYSSFGKEIFMQQQRHLTSSCDATEIPSEYVLPTAIDSQWQKVKLVRDHLRSAVFVEERESSEETDLVLDPEPDLEWVRTVLARYGFQKTEEAHRAIKELSREEIPLLSTRRCRHFLSAIAPQLLKKIGETPNPDLTLENLVLICRSLGGKGILWELFSSHEPSLDLTIRLCGASPYLVGILTSNPGMIDELLDSLMLNRLPTEQQLTQMLHELCRGAEDIDPIVHSFKNGRHLNVGVRDILGKESITDTHRALSDIADVCLQQVIDSQHAKLMQRYGLPMKPDGTVCRFAVVATGKLGGREPNYHSDISLLLLYESEGATQSVGATRLNESISNAVYFHQLAVRVGQAVNRVGRSGRLYEMKHWSISLDRTELAWTLPEFEEAARTLRPATLLMQQLCHARCIVGPPHFQNAIRHSILGLVKSYPWAELDLQSVRSNRDELLRTAGDRNLKRGQGGTIEVEILTQVLTLQHIGEQSELFVPGTVESIERLRGSGFLLDSDANRLRDGYNFLRSIESGLRLMNTRARHDLPESPIELARLAYVLNLPDSAGLVAQCDEHRRQIRTLYEKFV